jgi:hypothetical protein
VRFSKLASELELGGRRSGQSMGRQGKGKRWRWGENRLLCEWGRYESNFPPSRSGTPLATYRLSPSTLVQSPEPRGTCRIRWQRVLSWVAVFFVKKGGGLMLVGNWTSARGQWMSR